MTGTVNAHPAVARHSGCTVTVSTPSQSTESNFKFNLLLVKPCHWHGQKENNLPYFITHWITALGQAGESVGIIIYRLPVVFNWNPGPRPLRLEVRYRDGLGDSDCPTWSTTSSTGRLNWGLCRTWRLMLRLRLGVLAPAAGTPATRTGNFRGTGRRPRPVHIMMQGPHWMANALPYLRIGPAGRTYFASLAGPCWQSLPGTRRVRASGLGSGFRKLSKLLSTFWQFVRAQPNQQNSPHPPFRFVCSKTAAGLAAVSGRIPAIFIFLKGFYLCHRPSPFAWRGPSSFHDFRWKRLSSWNSAKGHW